MALSSPHYGGMETLRFGYVYCDYSSENSVKFNKKSNNEYI